MCLLLHRHVDRRHDVEAALVERGGAEAALDLLGDRPEDEVRRLHAGIGPRHDDDRLPLRLVDLRLGRHAVLDHEAEHLLLPGDGRVEVGGGAVRGRLLRDPGQQGRLGEREVMRRLAEVAL